MISSKTSAGPGSFIGPVAGLSDGSNEVLQLTQEALNLAQAACHFDKTENYVGAYDYYDKAILNIDEVMGKLPHTTSEWRKLLDLRCQYDDRMEQLKEMETRKYRANSISSEKSDVSETNNTGHRRRAKAQEMNFKEMNLADFAYIAPPSNPSLATLWVLGNIQKTIEHGGYLTATLFVPAKVWKQGDVKFTGLSAKTAAFEIIIKIIESQFSPLYFSPDEDSLSLAEDAACNMLEEMQSLQNQLSKPFQYIKEVPKHVDEESTHGSVGSLDEKKLNTKTTLTGFVAALGKNVRKYTEIGLSRLAVALPSKLSADELNEYTSLIVKLCSKAQIIGDWLSYALALQKGKVLSPHALLESRSGDSDEPRMNTMARQSSVAEVSVELNESALQRAEALVQALKAISQALRDIVCEILLRDIEYLLDKHLIRTRKTFSRMYWDDENASQGSNID